MKSNGIAHAHTKANKQSKEEAKKKRKFYFVIGNCILYCIELMIVEFYFSFFFHCNLTIDWYELLITFMSIFQLQRQWFKKKCISYGFVEKKRRKIIIKKTIPFACITESNWARATVNHQLSCHFSSDCQRKSFIILAHTIIYIPRNCDWLFLCFFCFSF